MADQLNEFGEILMTSVRDQSLFVLEETIKGQMKSESLKQLHNEIKSLSEEQIEILRKVAYRMVDMTLHNTLFMFEQEEDWVISNEGKDVENLAAVSDGLAGELYSDNGWIAKYSKYPTSL